MTDVIQLRRTYTAKRFETSDAGLGVAMSGTLEGYIDLAIRHSDGSHVTYLLTPAGARRLAAVALQAADDVKEHCLHDRDALLCPEQQP